MLLTSLRFSIKISLHMFTYSELKSLEEAPSGHELYPNYHYQPEELREEPDDEESFEN